MVKKPQCSYSRLKIKIPSFCDKVETEAVMRFAADSPKSGGFVDAAGGIEMALRPERDFLVAGLARETDAFVHEAAADAEAARARFDVE